MPVWLRSRLVASALWSSSKPALDEQAVVDPVEHFLRVIELLVGIAALAEARGIADGESVARVDDDLRQLAPDIPGEKRLLEMPRRFGARAENVAARRALRHGEQIGREVRFPAREQPLLAGLARAEAVVAIRFQRRASVRRRARSSRRRCLRA